MSDSTYNIAILRQAVAAFVTDRDWQQFHNPKNLSMSIAIEAAELMECFQWVAPERAVHALRDDARRNAVAAELADVLIYMLSLANVIDVDLSEAVLDKIRRNGEKYPADEWRGKAKGVD